MINQAADRLTVALAMPSPAAHREEIFDALLAARGRDEQLSEAFSRAAGRPLESTLRSSLGDDDWIRARAYLRHGTLRTADKVILAADGFGTDEDTLFRLMREARRSFEQTEADVRQDYGDVYSGGVTLFDISSSSRLAYILDEELSDWELDRARAILAFGDLRPVDQIQVATNRTGTEEEMLFSTLQRSDRGTIRQQWYETYGRAREMHLNELLESELSGDDLRRAQMTLEGVWDTRAQIRIAVNGIGTDEEAIWQTLRAMTPDERQRLTAEWQAHGEIWQLLDDDLDSDDMVRAAAYFAQQTGAIAQLARTGAMDGTDIVDAVKMSAGAELTTYRSEFTENSPFLQHIWPMTSPGAARVAPDHPAGHPRAAAALGGGRCRHRRGLHLPRPRPAD